MKYLIDHFYPPTFSTGAFDKKHECLTLWGERFILPAQAGLVTPNVFLYPCLLCFTIFFLLFLSSFSTFLPSPILILFAIYLFLYSFFPLLYLFLFLSFFSLCIFPSFFCSFVLSICHFIPPLAPYSLCLLPFYFYSSPLLLSLPFPLSYTPFPSCSPCYPSSFLPALLHLSLPPFLPKSFYNNLSFTLKFKMWWRGRKDGEKSSECMEKRNT